MTHYITPADHPALFQAEEAQPIQLVPMEEHTARSVLGWHGALATRQIAQVHQLQMGALHPSEEGFELRVRLIDKARDCLMRLSTNPQDRSVLIDPALQRAVLWQRLSTSP